MKAYEKQILRFFEGSDKIFKIPVYQRNYEWTEKQCKKLLDDISFSIENNMEYYFIGSIVYINNGKVDGSDEYLVIDGQQRLTTISLILIAIINLLDDEELKEKIKETYLINKWAKTDRERIKLKPIKADYDSFKKILNNSDFNKESKISKNYLFIKNKLKSLDQDKLNIFYESLSKLFVVDIDLERGKDDPQLIFESINSTGLNLEQSDLVRNFVLMKQENQELLYEQYWNQIENNTNFEVSRFIRDYLTLKNRIIPTEKNVYEDFKIFMFKNDYKHNIEDFLKELLQYSKYYKIILNSHFENNKDISHSLQRLKNLKITVSYPFLLELFSELDEGKIDKEIVKKTLNYIETFIIRRIICDISAKSLNNLFSYLGKEIQKLKKHSDDFYEVFKYVLNAKKGNLKMPSDQEFNEKFLVKEIYTLLGKDKSYIFEKIENYDKRNILNFEESSIEHIMPQTLTQTWKKELGENWESIHNKYLHTIGNLTLINKGDNSEIKNIPFDKKLDFIRSQTNYTLNNYFKNNALTTWGEQEIQERAGYLRDIAIKIWKYETSSFTPEKPEDLIYNFEDIEDYSELQGEYIEGYKFLSNEKNVESWRDFYRKFCRDLYDESPELFESLVQTQEIKGDSRIYFSSSKENLKTPHQLSDSIYIETNFAVIDFLKIISMLLQKFNIEKNSLEIYLMEAN